MPDGQFAEIEIVRDDQPILRTGPLRYAFVIVSGIGLKRPDDIVPRRSEGRHKASVATFVGENAHGLFGGEGHFPGHVVGGER